MGGKNAIRAPEEAPRQHRRFRLLWHIFERLLRQLRTAHETAMYRSCRRLACGCQDQVSRPHSPVKRLGLIRGFIRGASTHRWRWSHASLGIRADICRSVDDFDRCASHSPIISAVSEGGRGGFRQPLWMQRELWEPGTMPPGMRARLLRHYTFMHYGIQKDYQGATSNVGSSKDVIEEGARIYSQGVCGMSR